MDFIFYFYILVNYIFRYFIDKEYTHLIYTNYDYFESSNEPICKKKKLNNNQNNEKTISQDGFNTILNLIKSEVKNDVELLDDLKNKIQRTPFINLITDDIHYINFQKLNKLSYKTQICFKGYKENVINVYHIEKKQLPAIKALQLKYNTQNNNKFLLYGCRKLKHSNDNKSVDLIIQASSLIIYKWNEDYHDIIERYLNPNDELKNLDCPICQDKLIGPLKHVKTVPCSHYYHQTCINDWFNEDQNRSCPLCRRSIQDLE